VTQRDVHGVFVGFELPSLRRTQASVRLIQGPDGDHVLVHVHETALPPPIEARRRRLARRRHRLRAPHDVMMCGAKISGLALSLFATEK
jgi:hypothetical protein